MGYTPTDMIYEYNEDGDMWFTYDAGTFYVSGDPENRWDPDYDEEESEGEPSYKDPRNPQEYGLQPHFDVDEVEARIEALITKQREAQERIGKVRWERGERSGERHVYHIKDSFQVHPDGFITCDPLQAYSYYEEGIAVSAEDWIKNKIKQAEARAAAK
jgi:hypothetical protein